LKNRNDDIVRSSRLSEEVDCVGWNMQNLNDNITGKAPDYDAMNTLGSASEPATLLLSAHEARLLFRSGQYTGSTSFFSRGYVQGSLCILPQKYALDFAAYCHRNPKPCPLIAIGGVGDPYLPMLGEDFDVRTDLPSYSVFREGQVVEQPTDIKHLWSDDLVAFVWGCGFSFEQALIESGVTLRDVARGDNVVMYQTNIDTLPVGAFAGKMIVTMRPLVPAQAIRAIQVTSRFPSVHGAPIHIGLPGMIGISDLEKPYSSTPPQMRPDEIPVFWACGATPRLAVERAGLPFCITHKPGSMVISDRLNASLAIL
jgi:uncharacterized protein YcsI (UPF0317 family)